MGWLDRFYNGATSVVSGSADFVTDLALAAGRTVQGTAEFALDVGEATGEIATFRFGDAAETLFTSVQEDLMGNAVTGLFGPEGIGGTLIGAIPEQIRQPTGSLINPLFDVMNWSVNELVDRPLGTVATVVNATLEGGASNLFDASMWGRAWEINDQRTFGQSVAAAMYMIDPFDEDEYNSIQDDALFNMWSGSLDFVQEFIDPSMIVGGAFLKAGRGSLVSSKFGRKTAAMVDPTRVVGRGVGVRPTAIAGRTFDDFNAPTSIAGVKLKHNPLRGLVKNKDQLAKRRAIIETYSSARAQNFVETGRWGQVRDAVFEAAPEDRFGALRNALGRSARHLTPESIDILANSPTANAFDLNMRVIAGDIGALKEVQDIAGRLKELRQQAASMAGDVPESLTREINDLAESVDWAAMDAFDRAVRGTQQFALEWGGDRLTAQQGAREALTFVDSRLADEALDQILGMPVNQVGANFYGWAQMDTLPKGSRINGLFERHQQRLLDSGEEFVMSEHRNPNTFGANVSGPLGRVVRTFSEKIPQTIAHFGENQATFTQFERMLTTASRATFRLTDGTETRLIDDAAVNRKLSEMAETMRVAPEQMQTVFKDTIDELNSRADSFLADERYVNSKIDKNARSLTQQYKAAQDELVAALDPETGRALGITNSAGEEVGTKLTFLDSKGDEFHVFYRNSPSQMRQSMVIPRYDILAKQVDIFDKKAGVFGTRRKATGKAAEGVRRRSAQVSNVLESPQQFWRTSVLLTPKWPMRVGFDEQMRLASHLGATTMVANLVSGWGDLRRAYAVRNLDNWDEVGEVQNEMLRIAGREAGEEVDFWELYQEVGKEGYDAAVKASVKKNINSAKNRKKMLRNAGIRTVAAGAVINPLAGGIYGVASYASRRRRINQAARQTVALNYAADLRRQGQLLLVDAADDPALLAAVRQMESDADYIERMVEAGVEQLGEAQNLFDAADELMMEAGVPSLMIGNVQFRNAFGDDPRYQEEIRRGVSASRQQSVVMRGAVRDSMRELERFADSEWRAWDVLVDADAADFGDKWRRMMNLYTSNQVDNAFYQIVWGSAPNRAEQLADLLRNDERVFRQIVDGRFGFMTDDQLQVLSEAIVREYDNVLPPVEGLLELREKAASGIVEWSEVKAALSRMDDEGKNWRNTIDAIRGDTDFKDFGKSIAPDPKTINGSRRLAVKGKVEEYVEDLYTMFGSLPSDNLARVPMFKSVYERELRRRVEKLADADGNVRLSQKQIDRFENQSREVALGEVRDILYDLAEESRFGEIVGNAIPFFNAWQEVIGRWAGTLTYHNPTYTAEMFRLYKKEWEAETLGISEVTVNEGEAGESTYLMFRPFGSAVDEEGGRTTIFEAMSPAVRNLLIPKAVQDQNFEIRFSKDGLNTMLQASTPGFGPLVTVPIREFVLDNPELESTFQFMFPFGYPEGGFLERAVKANAPTWVKSVDDALRDTHTTERVVQRSFLDLVVQRELSGDPVDWSDQAEVNDLIEEANARAQQFNQFRIAAGLFSPTSTTLTSPYQPYLDRVRELTEEFGFRQGHAKFLDEYGEEFFALTARMTRLNNGVAASVENFEVAEKHADLIAANPEVGAWLSLSNMGAADERFAFSQAVYRRQQQTPISPGSDVMVRERKTPLETVADTESELGWIKYSEFNDWVRTKQAQAEAAGQSPSLNAQHMAPLRQMKQEFVANLAAEHPAWYEQFTNYGASDERMRDVIGGFVAGVQDSAILERPSTDHVLQYLSLRVWVQRTLEARKEAGGSANIESSSNADLQLMWETEKNKLGNRPEFSAIYDRYFERDNLREATFMSDRLLDEIRFVEAI